MASVQIINLNPTTSEYAPNQESYIHAISQNELTGLSGGGPIVDLDKLRDYWFCIVNGTHCPNK